MAYSCERATIRHSSRNCDFFRKFDVYYQISLIARVANDILQDKWCADDSDVCLCGICARNENVVDLIC